VDNPYAKSARNVLQLTGRECIDGVYDEYLYIDKCFSNYSQYTLSFFIERLKLKTRKKYLGKSFCDMLLNSTVCFEYILV